MMKTIKAHYNNDEMIISETWDDEGLLYMRFEDDGDFVTHVYNREQIEEIHAYLGRMLNK